MDTSAVIFSEATLDAYVIRCGCDGNPEITHGYDEYGALKPCPKPRSTNEVITGISVIQRGT